MTAPVKDRDARRLREAEVLLGGWDASAAKRPRKRSLTIAGHRSSISLEEPFWEGLQAIARDKGVSVASLVTAIDAVRGEVSLSSAIRLFVHTHRAGKPSQAMAGVRARRASSRTESSA